MTNPAGIKAGDLVKFVGVASYYKGTVGVVTKLYNPTASYGDNPNSAIVYIANKPDGRPSKRGPCFHPFCFTELELISEGG